MGTVARLWLMAIMCASTCIRWMGSLRIRGPGSRCPGSFRSDKNDGFLVYGSSPMVWTRDPECPKAPLGCLPKDRLFLRFNSTGRPLQTNYQ